MQPSSREKIVRSHDAIDGAVLANLDARARQRGQISLPCVPAALDHYREKLVTYFAHHGKSLTAPEQDQLRQSLRSAAEQGFARAAGSRLIVEFELSASQSLHKNLACRVSATTASVADEYKGWTSERGDAMFGRHPDAHVTAVAARLSPGRRVLDVGAGTGRNALPLARRGLIADALELTPEFCDRLVDIAAAEQLPVNVIRGDVLDPAVKLGAAHYDLAIVSEVISHFRDPTQLRQLFERLSHALAPSGLLLFNLFLSDEQHDPSPLTRDVSQVAWSNVFTRMELTEALDNLPLTLQSDVSTVEYEHAHLPPDAWPPTGWFVTWSTGRAVVPLENGFPPFELRWILCQRD